MSPILLPSPPNVERFLRDAEIPKMLPSVAGCSVLHSRQESTSAIHDIEAGRRRNPPNKSTQQRIWSGVVGDKFGIGVLWRTLQAPDSTKEHQKKNQKTANTSDQKDFARAHFSSHGVSLAQAMMCFHEP